MFATLHEQRAARRWRTFIRLAWLAFFVFLLWALMHRGAPSTGKSLPHTAVIEIKGEIASGGDASAEAVVAAMRSAFEDTGAQAVVLLINSPGGSPVQAGIINDEIKRLEPSTRSRSTPWSRNRARPPPTTSPRRPTRFSWTRPASSAASAC